MDVDNVCMVDGVVLGANYKNIENDIYNLEVYENDIWVISFPKSGTTWTQEMVWLIGNDLNFDEAQKPLAIRFPFLEISGVLDGNSFGSIFDGDEIVGDSVGIVRNMQQPRFVKSHLPYYLLPKQMDIKKPKMIYVTRNPKDVVVSYYHHFRLFGYKGTLEEYFELFINDKVHYSPYWPNISSFWNKKDQSNLLIIRYEDMKTNLPSVINTVASFLNKTLTVEQVAKLTDHLSFEKMKDNPAVNYEAVSNKMKENKVTDASSRFMRSGTIGSHKAEMTEEMIERMDKWIEENICEGYNI